MARKLFCGLLLLALSLGQVAWAGVVSPVTPELLSRCQDRAQANPDSVDAHFELAMAYARTAYLESGWAELKRVYELDAAYADKIIARSSQQLKKNPSNVEALFRLSFAYYFTDQKEKAIAVHRKILKINPRYVWSYNYLAYLLAEQGKVDEAIALLRQALTLDPQNAVAHFLIGHGYYRQGNTQDAAIAIATAMRLRLTHPI